ncbi:hypothetical protein BH11ACT4_BH11ACT4_00030 [soil metagenome]
MSDVTPSKSSETSAEVADPALDQTRETPETPATPAEAAEAAESAAQEPQPQLAPELVEPVTVSADTAAVESAVAEPVAVADPEPTPVAEPEPVIVPVAVAAASAVPAQQTVYVAPPVPPKKRGNRLVGTLLSIVGAILFVGVYGVVSAFILDLRGGDLFGPDFLSFLSSAFFWVPVATFLVGLILMVLILNRAGWWAHVLGSLILAVAVYFGMIGLLLLIGNVFHGSPTPVTFGALAVNPWVITAAVAAREVSIWTGLGIASRGRRVKLRNVEARASFDREQDAQRAEHAGTGSLAGV